MSRAVTSTNKNDRLNELFGEICYKDRVASLIYDASNIFPLRIHTKDILLHVVSKMKNITRCKESKSSNLQNQVLHRLSKVYVDLLNLLSAPSFKLHRYDILLVYHIIIAEAIIITFHYAFSASRYMYNSAFRSSIYNMIQDIFTGVHLPRNHIESTRIFYFGGESESGGNKFQVISRSLSSLRGSSRHHINYDATHNLSLRKLRDKQDANSKDITSRANEIRRQATLMRLKQIEFQHQYHFNAQLYNSTSSPSSASNPIHKIKNVEDYPMKETQLPYHDILKKDREKYLKSQIKVAVHHRVDEFDTKATSPLLQMHIYHSSTQSKRKANAVRKTKPRVVELDKNMKPLKLSERFFCEIDESRVKKTDSQNYKDLSNEQLKRICSDFNYKNDNHFIKKDTLLSTSEYALATTNATTTSRTSCRSSPNDDSHIHNDDDTNGINKKFNSAIDSKLPIIESYGNLNDTTPFMDNSPHATVGLLLLVEPAGDSTDIITSNATTALNRKKHKNRSQHYVSRVDGIIKRSKPCLMINKVYKR